MNGARRWAVVQLGLLVLIVSCADAQTTWTAGAGDWFTPANWDSGVPGPADQAVVPGAFHDVTIFGAAALASHVTVSGASALHIIDHMSMVQTLPIGRLRLGADSGSVIDGDSVFEVDSNAMGIVGFAVEMLAGVADTGILVHGELIWRRGKIRSIDSVKTVQISSTGRLALHPSPSGLPHERALESSILHLRGATDTSYLESDIMEAVVRSSEVVVSANGVLSLEPCPSGPGMHEIRFDSSALKVTGANFSSCLGYLVEANSAWEFTDGRGDFSGRLVLTNSDFKLAGSSVFANWDSVIEASGPSAMVVEGTSWFGGTVSLTLRADSSFTLQGTSAVSLEYSTILTEPFTAVTFLAPSHAHFLHSNSSLNGVVEIRNNVTVDGGHHVMDAGGSRVAMYDFARVSVSGWGTLRQNMGVLTLNDNSMIVANEASFFWDASVRVRNQSRLNLVHTDTNMDGNVDFQLFNTASMFLEYSSVFVHSGGIEAHHQAGVAIRDSYMEMNGRFIISDSASVVVDQFGSFGLENAEVSFRDTSTLFVDLGNFGSENKMSFTNDSRGVFRRDSSLYLFGAERCPENSQLWTCDCSCGMTVSQKTCAVGIPSNACHDLCIADICPEPCMMACGPPQCTLSCSGPTTTVQGDLTVDHRAELYIVDSFINIEGGVVRLLDGSNFTMSNSYGWVEAGDFILQRSAQMLMSQNSAMDVAGNIRVREAALVLLRDDSRLNLRGIDYCPSGLVYTDCFCSCGGTSLNQTCDQTNPDSHVCENLCYDNACGGFGDGTCHSTCMLHSCNSFCPTNTTFIRADVEVVDVANMTMTDSTLELSLGELRIFDFASVTLMDSAVFVQDGNLATDGQAKLFIDDLSQFDVFGGQIILRGNSTVQVLEGSSFGLQQGDGVSGSLLVTEDATLSGRNSYIYMYDGVLRVDGRGTLAATISVVEVDGALNVADEGSFSLFAMTYMGVGGSLLLSGHAAFNVIESSCDVWGVLTANDNATLSIQNSTFVIPIGEVCPGQIEFIWCSCDCTGTTSNATCAVDDDWGSCHDRCLFDLCPGSMFPDLDESCLDTCNFEHSFCHQRCSVPPTFTTGSLSALDNTAMQLRYSYFELQFGSLTMRNQATFEAIGGYTVVQDGSLLAFDNVMVTGTANAVVQVKSGTMGFADNTQLQLTTQSAFEVEDGTVTMSQNVQAFLADDSTLAVFGGRMNILHNALVQLRTKSTCRVEGELFVSNRGVLDMIGSTIDIGGKSRFHDNSTVMFRDSNSDSNSLVRGSFEVLDSSQFIMKDSTLFVSELQLPCAGTSFWDTAFCRCFPNGVATEQVVSCPPNAMEEGSLEACELLCMGTACGGNSTCVDSCGERYGNTGCSVPYEYSPGRLKFQNRATGAVNGSQIFVDPGVFETLDDSELQVVDTLVQVTNGIMRFAGRSLLTMLSSEVGVNPGNVTATSTAQLHMTSSNFSLSDGTVTFKDQVNVFMETRSGLEVGGGTLFLANTANVTMIGASTTYVGGLLDITNSAHFRIAQGSHLDVAGTVNLAGDPLFEVLDSSGVVSGDMAARDDALVVIEMSSFSIYDSELPCGGVLYWDYCRCRSMSLSHDETCALNAGGPVALGLCETACRDAICFGQPNVTKCENDVEYECYDACDMPIVRRPGKLELTTRSSLVVLNSSVALHPGHLELHDASQMDIDRSTVNIIDGSLRSEENALVDAHNTDIILQSGNVKMFNKSRTILQANSYLSIADGEVALFGNSTLQVLIESSYSVGGGQLLVADDGFFQLDMKSDGDVTGVMVLQDRSQFVIGDNSSQEVYGTFSMKNSSMGAIALSTVDVYGTFEARGMASLEMRQSGLFVWEKEVCHAHGWVTCECDCIMGMHATVDCMLNAGTELEKAACQNQCRVYECADEPDPSACEMGCIDDGCNFGCQEPEVFVPGKFSFGDSAQGTLVDSTVQLNPGRVDFFGNSVFLCTDGSSVGVFTTATNRGTMNFENNAAVTFDKNSSAIISHGDVFLSGNASVSISAGSYLQLDAGVVDVSGAAALNVMASSLFVYGGLLSLSNTSSVALHTSYGEVGGSLSVNGASTFDLTVNSTFEVSGSVDFRHASVVLVSKSEFYVRGSVKMQDIVQYSMTDAILSIELIYPMCSPGNSYWQTCFCSCADNTGVSFSCAPNSFTPEEYDMCLNQCYDVSCAGDPTCISMCDARDEGWCEPGCDDPGADMPLPGVLEIGGQAVAHMSHSFAEISPGLLNVTDEGTLSVVDGSLVRVFDGVLNVEEQGSLSLTGNAEGELVGGTVRFQDRSSYFSSASNFFVYDGAVEMNGNATVRLVSTSSFSLHFGTVNMAGNLNLHMSNSTMAVFGGQLVLGENSDTLLERSIMGVGGGEFRVVGDADVTATMGSTLSVNDGLLLMGNTSNVELRDSAVQVGGGLWTTEGDAEVNLFDSVYNMTFGDVRFGSRSALRFTNSFIQASSGTIIAADSSDIQVTGSYMDLLGVQIRTEDMGDLLLTRTAVDLEDGLIELTDFGVFDLTNSSLTMDGANTAAVQFIGNASLVLQSSSLFKVVEGSVDMFGSGIASVTASTLHVAGGFMTLHDLSSISLVDSSNILVTNGSFTFDTTNTAEVRDGSSIEVRSGLMEIINGKLHMFDDSTVSVTGGDMDFRGNALISSVSSNIVVVRGQLSVFQSSNVSLTANSSVLVTGGNFLMTDFVTVEAQSSLIDVQRGSLVLDLDTVFEGVNSTIGVSGGDMSILGDVAFAATESAVSVTNGSLSFFGAGISAFSACAVDISAGNVFVDELRTVQLDLSGLDITGGQLSVTGTLNQIETSTTVCGGSVHFSQNAHSYQVLGSTTVCGGNYTAHDDSLLDFVHASVDVSGGSLSLLDRSCITLHNTSFQVTGGSFLKETDCHLVVSESSIIVDGGVLCIGGGGHTDISGPGAHMTVISGQLIFKDNATVAMAGASLNAIGGDFLLQDQAQLTGSRALVSVSGGLFSSSGTTYVGLANSSIILSNGSMSLAGFSYSEYTDTSLDITGGNFDVEDGAQLVAIGSSTFTIAGGNFNILNWGGLFMGEGSSITVTNGQSVFGDNSTLVLGSGVPFSMTNGSFTVQDAANVRLDDSNALSLTGGSFVMRDDATFSGVAVDVDIDGGDLNVEGGVFSVSGTGAVSITSGSARFCELSNVQFDDTNLTISGGDFIACGHTVVLFSGASPLTVEGGNFHVTDNSSVTLMDGSMLKRGAPITTSVTISGGSSLFDGTSQFVMGSNVAFTQTGGSFVIAEQAGVDMTYGGNVVTLSGGSFIVQDNSTYDADGTEMSIDGGSLLVSGRASFTVSGGSEFIIIDGSLTFAGEGLAQIIWSQFTVAGGNVTVGSSRALELSSASALNVTAGHLVVSGTLNQLSSLTTVCGGNVEFVADGTSYQQYGATRVCGGNYSAHDDVVLDFHHSDVTVESGSLSLFDRACIQLRNSSFGVTGGSFNQETVCDFMLDGSGITVDGGMLCLGGNGNTYLNGPGAYFTVTSGQLIFKDNVTIHANSAVFTVTGGDLLVQDAAMVVGSDTHVSVSGGIFSVEGISVVDLSGSSVVLSNGSMNFDENSQSFFVDTSIDITGGSFTAQHAAGLIVRGASPVTIAGGNFNILNSASLLVNGTGSSVTVTNGQSVFGDNSTLVMGSGVPFSMTNGSFTVQDAANVRLDDSNALSLTGGSFVMRDDATFSGVAVDVDIDGGDLNVEGGVFSVSGTGAVSITSGSARFCELSNVQFDDTNLTISGGDFIACGHTVVLFSGASPLTVEGGNFHVTDNSSVTLMDGSMLKRGAPITTSVTISGGSSLFDGTSQFVMGSNVAFMQTGGSFVIAEQAGVDMTYGGNVVTLSGGSFIVQDNGEYDALNVNVDINGGSLLLRDDSKLSATASSHFTVSSGSYVVNGATVVYEDSSVQLSGGDAEIHSGIVLYDDSTLSIQSSGKLVATGGRQSFTSSSQVTISGGSFDGSNNAQTVVTGSSSIRIQSGDMKLSGSSYLDVRENSLVHITNGDLVKSGSSESVFEDSELVLAGNGGVAMQSNSMLITSGSDVKIEDGSLTLDHSAAMTAKSSTTVSISGGSLIAKDEASLTGSSVTFTISSGSATFQGSSVIEFSGSAVRLTGGQLSASGSANVLFQSSSVDVLNGKLEANEFVEIRAAGTTDVTVGGDVSLSGSAKLLLDDTTSVVVNGGGDLQLSGSSQLLLGSGTSVLVDGGDLTADNSAGINAFEAAVTVQSGALTMRGMVRSTVEDSSVIVSNGAVVLEGLQQLDVFGGSSLSVTGAGSLLSRDESHTTVRGQSSVSVAGGHFTVVGLSSFFAREGSVLRVDGGVFEAYESGTVDVNHSELLVLSGSMQITGLATFLLQDAECVVTGGSLLFGGNCWAAIDHTNVTVAEGTGLFQTIDDAVVELTNSNLTAVGGGVAIGGSSNTSIVRGYVLIGNSFAVLGSAKTVFNETTVSVVTGEATANETSSVTFVDTDLLIESGSLSLLGSSQTTINRASVTIQDNLRASDFASVVIDSSSFVLQSGVVDVSGNSQMTLRSSTMEVYASLLMSGNSIWTVSASTVVLDTGSINLQGASVLSMASGTVATLQSGDVLVSGSASLLVTSSTLRVGLGVSKREEQGAVLDGSISVTGSGRLLVTAGSGATVSGSVALSGNAEVECSSSSTIDIENGDLDVSGNALLRVSQSSIVTVKSGVVRTSGAAEIRVTDNSAIINQGELLVGGPVIVPTGNMVQVDPSGVLSISGTIDIGTDGDAPGTLDNNGMLDMCEANGGTVTVSVTNGGSMFVCDGSTFFDSLSTSGQLALLGAELQTGSSPLSNTGSLFGTASVEGDIVNNGDIIHGEDGTLLEVENFENGADGTLYIVIDDPEDIGLGMTRIEAAREARFAGAVVICLGDFDTDKYDRIELILYDDREGEFEDVRFECIEEKHRATKHASHRTRSLAHQQRVLDSDPDVDYDGRSFAVLFSGTGGSGWDPSDPIFWLSVSLFALAMICIVVNVILYMAVPKYRRMWIGNQSGKLQKYRRSRRTQMMKIDSELASVQDGSESGIQL